MSCLSYFSVCTLVVAGKDINSIQEMNLMDGTTQAQSMLINIPEPGTLLLLCSGLLELALTGSRKKFRK
jgi:hypothetical protein